MSVSSLIARRFLFSRSSHSIVNLISVVSAVAVMVPVAAMVIILSLHNGLEHYIGGMYSQFDAPIQIKGVDGANFSVDSLDVAGIAKFGSVAKVYQIEGLVEWGDRQVVTTLRGVDSNYVRVTDVGQLITQGRWSLAKGDLPQAVVGAGVSYALGMSIAISEPMVVYALMPALPMMRLFPVPLYSQAQIWASGVFGLDEATDSKYIFVGLDFLWSLTGNDGLLSSIEVRPKGDVNDVAKKLQAVVGDKFVVKTAAEQRSTIFKIINSERWLILALMMFVVVIASLSLAGCVLMMISEKRKQSSTLSTMGLSDIKIRAIFSRLGFMVIGIGTALGLVIGVGLALAQQYWGVIEMAGDSFLMESYPCRVELFDLVVIGLGVTFVGGVIVKLAARSAKR